MNKKTRLILGLVLLAGGLFVAKKKYDAET